MPHRKSARIAVQEEPEAGKISQDLGTHLVTAHLFGNVIQRLDDSQA